jgi:hypothetical protein
MEAAHVLHFPNSDKKKTRITFIDINADKEKDEFIIRNRHYFEVQSFYYRDFTVNNDKTSKVKDYLCFQGKDADFLVPCCIVGLIIGALIGVRVHMRTQRHYRDILDQIEDAEDTEATK